MGVDKTVMARPQDKNLRPAAHPLTVEDQSMGGKKSGEVRRAKKTLREYAEKLLSCKVKDPRVEAQFKKLGIDPESGTRYTFSEAILIGQIVQAVKGNTKAYNAIKDTVEPKDSTVGVVVEDLSPLADLLRMGKRREEDDGEDDE